MRDNFYTRTFGGLSSLGDQLPWTEGVANIYEHIAWYSAAILGVNKTTYWKTILTWADEPELRALPIADRITVIARRLQEEVDRNEGGSRYEKRSDTIAKPYECLRRARYFSEDYLNKEFDIFLSLASDAYVSALYERILGIRTVGNWSTHGNGGRLQNATLFDMQADNICFNGACRVVVANELKLGGSKNPDQILKYAKLFLNLSQTGLAPPGSRFCLVFISDRHQAGDWDDVLDAEIDHARRSRKPSAARLVSDEVIAVARAVSKAETTWDEMRLFNEDWAATLPPAQVVEHKLIDGFNRSLAEKFYLLPRAAE